MLVRNPPSLNIVPLPLNCSDQSRFRIIEDIHQFCCLFSKADNTGLLAAIHTSGHADRRVQQCLYLHRTPADRMLQCFAFQILHGDERISVRVANVINCADIWMVQRRCRLGFPLKSRQCLCVSCYVFRQELQRGGPGVHPRPCTPLPCHRRRVSQECDSAIWFGQEETESRACGGYVSLESKAKSMCSYS
jgi:hypothetical protein